MVRIGVVNRVMIKENIFDRACDMKIAPIFMNCEQPPYQGLSAGD